MQTRREPGPPAIAVPPVTIRLNRSLVATALFFFYVLAFVAAPYWLVSESRAEKAVFLLLTVLLGLLWTRLAANEVQLQIDRRSRLPAALLLLVAGLLNIRALTAAIPYRGDESYHIALALNIARMIPPSLLAAGIVMLLLSFGLAWQKPKYAWVAWLLFVAGFTAFYLLRRPPELNAIIRYPFVSRWFHALVPALLRPLTGLQHEALYRLVPFLSAVALCWVFARSVASRGTLEVLALGAAAATIPVLLYYSSMLFLEMPAVVLMFLVCLHIEQLLSASYDELTKDPYWLALILIGFIKETSVVFLLVFVACRIFFRLMPSAERGLWKRLLRDELSMALGTLLPLAIYLFFRSYFGNPREFHFNLANLLDLRALSAALLAHLQQFGPIYLLFIGGMVLLFRTRRYRKAVFLLLLFVGVPMFHLVDTVRFAGYSRFNLFILPPVLAGSVVFLQFLGAKKKWYLPALAVVLIAANLAMTPMNIDGTRDPAWGNPGEDFYPYPEALSWIRDQQKHELLVFAGLSYDYYFDFYFDKLNWHPRYELLKDFHADDPASFGQALQTAEQRGATCVVVSVDENPAQAPQLPRMAHKWRLRIFSNMAHSLLVFAEE